MRALRVTLAGAFLITSLGGAGSSVHLALSDCRSRLFSIPERKRAAESGVCSPEFWLRLYELKQESGKVQSKELEAASRCNPLDSGVLIRLALKYESDGDLMRAADYLHRAAQVDRGFVPAWSLANYYLRRNESNLFFEWIHKALAVTSTDATPVFYLAWNICDDKDRILSAMPRTEFILSQYVAWLSRSGRSDAAYDAARLLPHVDSKLTRNALDRLRDQLSEAGDAERANSIWNLAKEISAKGK